MEAAFAFRMVKSLTMPGSIIDVAADDSRGRLVRDKKERNHTKQNPQVCALCLRGPVDTFSIFCVRPPRWCTSVGVWRGLRLNVPSISCAGNGPNLPWLPKSPHPRAGKRQIPFWNWSCGVSIKLSITQLVCREVQREKLSQLSHSLCLV